MKENKISNSWTVLRALTRRHLKMFFKNKMTFFFSLLVPLITLAIYLLFLRDLELSSVKSIIIAQGLSETDPLMFEAYNLADAWMLSGIIAVSLITVSFNTCYIIINDREKGVSRDFVSSPIRQGIINLSYFVFNFIVTFIIGVAILIIALIYLQVAGSFYLSASNFFILFSVMILSSISAATVTVLIASFINSSNIFNSLIAIVSAAVGFLIGGYMPISMLPEPAQNLTAFFPGTYSAGLFRNYFLQDQLAHLEDFMASDPRYADIREAVLEQFSSSFSLNLEAFGFEINVWMMWVILFGFIVFFSLLNFFFANRNLRLGAIGKRAKVKKAKKESD